MLSFLHQNQDLLICSVTIGVLVLRLYAATLRETWTLMDQVRSAPKTKISKMLVAYIILVPFMLLVGQLAIPKFLLQGPSHSSNCGSDGFFNPPPYDSPGILWYASSLPHLTTSFTNKLNDIHELTQKPFKVQRDTLPRRVRSSSQASRARKALFISRTINNSNKVHSNHSKWKNVEQNEDSATPAVCLFLSWFLNFRFCVYFYTLFWATLLPPNSYVALLAVLLVILHIATRLFVYYFFFSTPTDLITFYATIETESGAEIKMSFMDRARRFCFDRRIVISIFLHEQYDYLRQKYTAHSKTLKTVYEYVNMVCSSLFIVLVLLTCYSVSSPDHYSDSASSSCRTFRSAFPPTISSNNFTCALSREALNHILLCGGDTETNPGPAASSSKKNVKPDAAPTPGKTVSMSAFFLQELTLSQRKELVMTLLENIFRLEKQGFLEEKWDHLPKDKDGKRIRPFPCLCMNDEKAAKQKNKFTFAMSVTSIGGEKIYIKIPVHYRINQVRRSKECGTDADAQRGLYVGDDAFAAIPFFHYFTALATGETYEMISQLCISSRRRTTSGMTLPLDPNHDHDISMQNDNSTSLTVVQGMNCNQHHSGCVNPACVSLEFDATNISRKDCPAGSRCQHYSKCCAPGSNFRRFERSCGISLKDDLIPLFETFASLKLRVPGATDGNLVDDNEKETNKNNFEKNIKDPLLQLAKKTRTLSVSDKKSQQYIRRNDKVPEDAKMDSSILTFFGNYSDGTNTREWDLARGDLSANAALALDPANYQWADGGVESQDNGWVENLFAGNTTRDAAGRELRPFTVDERISMLRAYDKAARRNVFSAGIQIGTTTIVNALTKYGAFDNEDGSLNKDFQELFRSKLGFCKRPDFAMHRVPFIILFDRFDYSWAALWRYMQISHRNHHGGDYRLSNLMLETQTYNDSRQGCFAGEHCWHFPKCDAPGLYSLYAKVPGISINDLVDDLRNNRDPKDRIRSIRFRQHQGLNWIAFQRLVRSKSVPGLPDYPPDLHLPLPDDWQHISENDNDTKYFRKFLTHITTDKDEKYFDESERCYRDVNLRRRFVQIVRDCVTGDTDMDSPDIIAMMYFTLLPIVLQIQDVSTDAERQRWRLSFLRHLHPRRNDSIAAMRKWFGKHFWSEQGSLTSLQANKQFSFLQNGFTELKLNFGVKPGTKLPLHDQRFLQISFEFWSGSQARQRLINFYLVSQLFWEAREWKFSPKKLTNVLKGRGKTEDDVKTIKNDLLEIPVLAKKSLIQEIEKDGQLIKNERDTLDRFPYEHLEFLVYRFCGFTYRTAADEFPGEALEGRFLSADDIQKIEELHYIAEDKAPYFTQSRKLRFNKYVQNALEATRQQLLPIIAEENKKLDELIEIIEGPHRQQFRRFFNIPDYFEGRQKTDEGKKASYVIFLASRSQQEAEELLKRVRDAGYRHESFPWCIPHHFVRKNPRATEYGLFPELINKIDPQTGHIDLTRLVEDKVVCEFVYHVQKEKQKNGVSRSVSQFYTGDFHMLLREFDNESLRNLNGTKRQRAAEAKKRKNANKEDAAIATDTDTDDDNNNKKNSSFKPLQQKTATRRARAASTNNNNNNNNNNMTMMLMPVQQPVQEDTAAASAGPTSSRSQKKQQQTLINQTPSTDAAAPNNNNTTAAAANRGRGSSSTTKKPGTKLEFNK